MEKFKLKFPEEFRDKIDVIEKFVVDYIQEHGFTVKFINSCSTGFMGVRTKDQVIICRPTGTMGDFIYTIFHEIRHDNQIKEIKMKNPLTDFDLEDFEKLYEQYWEMELDADQFAKNMIAKLVIKLNIPIWFAKGQFSLSHYIEQYPLMSKSVESSLRSIVGTIQHIKKSGGKYEDIQDHPMVQRFIDKLENFI